MLTDVVVPLGAVAIHWFGQSWFAFKDAAGLVVQVDPYGPRERAVDTFIHPESPIDEATLRTDCVLLTHEHGDHTCIESLLRIHAAFPEACFYGPHESIARLRASDIPQSLLFVVAAGETWTVGTLKFHAVWAKPPGGVPEEEIPPPDVEHLGYVLELGGRRIYISGDPIHTFSRHEALLAAIRAYQPEIGLLTTHPSEGEFPFFEGSMETAVKLKLKAAVPAHYDCFIQRTYDPQLWANAFPVDGPQPLIIPYNGTMIYQG